MDEFALLTLNEEEYKQAISDFDDYVQKHCRYKHYKERDSAMIPMYRIIAGEFCKSYVEKLIKNARKRKVETTIAVHDGDSSKQICLEDASLGQGDVETFCKTDKHGKAWIDMIKIGRK